MPLLISADVWPCGPVRILLNGAGDYARGRAFLIHLAVVLVMAKVIVR